MQDQLAKREARGRTPEFQAAIAHEKAEFSNILHELGENALDAGMTTLLKTPTETFLKALKSLYSSKYGVMDLSKDVLKLFFGKNGVAHSTLKVAANAIHLAGKGVKIGVRELLKI